MFSPGNAGGAQASPSKAAKGWALELLFLKRALGGDTLMDSPESHREYLIEGPYLAIAWEKLLSIIKDRKHLTTEPKGRLTI